MYFFNLTCNLRYLKFKVPPKISYKTLLSRYYTAVKIPSQKNKIKDETSKKTETKETHSLTSQKQSADLIEPSVNENKTWAVSQTDKNEIYRGARFEQIDINARKFTLK